MNKLDFCNTCGGSFSAGKVVLPGNMTRRGWAATRDKHHNITQYCCESCTDDLMPPPDTGGEQSELSLDDLDLATGRLA